VTAHPEFNVATLTVDSLCGGHYDRPILVQCWDHVADGPDQLNGELLTTLKSIVHTARKRLPLRNELHRLKDQRHYKSSGSLVFRSAQVFTLIDELDDEARIQEIDADAPFAVHRRERCVTDALRRERRRERQAARRVRETGLVKELEARGVPKALHQLAILEQRQSSSGDGDDGDDSDDDLLADDAEGADDGALATPSVDRRCRRAEYNEFLSSAERAPNTKQLTTTNWMAINFSCRGLRANEVWSKADVFLEVFSMPRDRWMLIGRTPVFRDSLEPRWQPMLIDLQRACSRNRREKTAILVRVMSWSRLKRSTLFGAVQTTVQRLSKGRRMPIVQQALHQKYGDAYKNSGYLVVNGVAPIGE
jgi:hypothetical protein